jgi:hypothetical protein
MDKAYLLDTNAYALLFHRTESNEACKLRELLTEGKISSFYISEITSLEIHSVVGKYRRGVQTQKQICKRKIIENKEIKDCKNIWYQKGVKKIGRKLYRDIQKLIKDIEAQKGSIKACIIKLSENAIAEGANLLVKYSDRYRFGSLDAMIAGSLIDMKRNSGIALTMVTSDKGLKAVLSEENIPVFDPNKVA